jgi:hypothetical protein
MKAHAVTIVLALGIFFCAGVGFASGETRIYKETTGGKEVTGTYAIEPTTQGFLINAAALENGVTKDRTALQVDASFSTLAVQYENDQGTAITACREGDTVHLSGTYEGKKVDRKYKIGSLPWKQLFPIDLEKSVQAGPVKFCAIAFNGHYGLRLGTFDAKVKGNERVSVSGHEADAVHVRIAMAGLLSSFWHCDCWYRRSDGKYLQYRGVNNPGAAASTIQLASDGNQTLFAGGAGNAGMPAYDAGVKKD